MPPQTPERRTVSRAAGLSIAAVTAGVVFLVGAKVWPPPAPPVVVAAAPAPSPSVLPPSPPDATEPAADAQTPADGHPVTAPDGQADGAVALGHSSEASDAQGPSAVDASAAPDSAGGADAGTVEDTPASRRAERKRRRKEAAAAAAAVKSAKPDGAVAAGDPSTDPRRANAPLPPSDGSAATPSGEPSQEATTADCALAEKEMARQSWRRNWPAICSVAGSGKAFILIPLKGSLEGETHALLRRPNREARISLPAGSEALLTLKQYKVRRLGFKDLRVNTTEDGGTRLRVKLLPGAGDPVFEVKDGYAKITVAVPEKS